MRIALFIFALLSSVSGYSQSAAFFMSTVQASEPGPEPEPSPSNFYHTTITVSDGAANAFVYVPAGVENPPPGGWPLAINFNGDGTSNNATTTVTGTSMSTSDNLTYTSTPTVWYGTVMASEVRIKRNGVEVAKGKPGGAIEGDGVTGMITGLGGNTISLSVTFDESQSGQTITYDWLYSMVLYYKEGPMAFLNVGDEFDNRAIIICIQNIQNAQDYDRDYWDNTVTYAWNNFTINPNRISAWGISRGGRQIISQFSDGSNTSVLKTRYRFWIKNDDGTITASDPEDEVNYTESGLASFVVGTADYNGTFTAVNYTDIGMAAVHGTSDGTLTNNTYSFAATMSGNNEPPYIYNVRGGFHDYNVWSTECYNRQWRTDSVGTAPWDFVDFTFKYSRDPLERATLFVEQAEKRRYGTEKDIIDYRHALRQVNALEASSEKTALLGRLSTLKDEIDNGGTRWVINFHSSGQDESSPYNNFASSSASTTISNIVDFDGGASTLDVELDTDPGGGMSTVGSSRRSWTGGFSKTANNSGLVLTGWPFGVFKMTGVPSGTYTVRFYHNVGVSNFSGDPRLRVTLNSETKAAYSAVNTLLGYIEFTGVPHTALASFETSYDTNTNTILTIIELYKHP